MKILFLLHKRNRLRNFTSVIRALGDRGHIVRVAFVPIKQRYGIGSLFGRDLHITSTLGPGRREDVWKRLADFSRTGRDYLRYLQPSHEFATKLKERAFSETPHPFRRMLKWSVVRKRLGMYRRFLEFLEDLIPTDAGVDEFIQDEKPDVILLTPLVQKQSHYQVDYVKAAHRFGIPVAFLPFSWDNLTNKGLMRIQPDRVFVWNDVQRREAIEIHGVSPDRIAVCGAWRFDAFYARTSQTGREEFCGRVGLRSDRPYVLYLGSSEFTAPAEHKFVRRWIEALRRSEEPSLRTCGVLIKPYPDKESVWPPLERWGFENVALWRSMPGDGENDQGLYEGIFHSAACVGINTSAMIEAAIVGRPVHTVLVDRFYGGQAGTFHFHYLTSLNGGLLIVGKDLEEHSRQLAASLAAGPDSARERARRFAAGFLRPMGPEIESTPLVVEQIEKLVQLDKRPQQAPLWLSLFRLGLTPVLWVALFLLPPEKDQLEEAARWGRRERLMRFLVRRARRFLKRTPFFPVVKERFGPALLRRFGRYLDRPASDKLFTPAMLEARIRSKDGSRRRMEEKVETIQT